MALRNEHRVFRSIAGLVMMAVMTGPCPAQGWQSPGQSDLQAMPGARAEVPQSRIGETFWVQRKGRPFSIDFFGDGELRERFPVEGTRHFVVVALTRTRDGQPVYQVEFETGEQAFVTVDAFESELYVDPSLTSEMRFKSFPYLSPEAYLYSIKSIFSEDPDPLAERIERLGPSRIIDPGAEPAPGAPPR